MKTIILRIKWLLQINLFRLIISTVRRVVFGHMEIYEIDVGLFQSSKFSTFDFPTIQALGIGAIIDLEGGRAEWKRGCGID